MCDCDVHNLNNREYETHIKTTKKNDFYYDFVIFGTEWVEKQGFIGLECIRPKQSNETRVRSHLYRTQITESAVC